MNFVRKGITMFNLFSTKTTARKPVEYWKDYLAQKPIWQLENIVRNPGEFVIEMREATAQLLNKTSIEIPRS